MSTLSDPWGVGMPSNKWNQSIGSAQKVKQINLSVGITQLLWDNGYL